MFCLSMWNYCVASLNGMKADLTEFLSFISKASTNHNIFILHRYSDVLVHLKWIFVYMFKYFKSFPTFRHFHLVVYNPILKDHKFSALVVIVLLRYFRTLSEWDWPSARNTVFILYFNTRYDPLFWQIGNFISQVIIRWVNVDLLIAVYISVRNYQKHDTLLWATWTSGRSLNMTEGLELDGFQGSSQPKFCILVLKESVQDSFNKREDEEHLFSSLSPYFQGPS